MIGLYSKFGISSFRSSGCPYTVGIYFKTPYWIHDGNFSKISFLFRNLLMIVNIYTTFGVSSLSVSALFLALAVWPGNIDD